MDIFSRLHLRRPPSSTKKSRTSLSSPDTPELPPRPFTSFESSIPPSPISKSSTDVYATTRSIPDRPVFTPAPTTTPKSRTPSLLRSLKHHSSLSVLKSRRKSRAKLQDVLPLPDMVLPAEVPNERPVSRLVKKRSLKGSKSVPRGLRLSGESETWRASEEIPPLPLSSQAVDTSKFNTAPVKPSLPTRHPVLASPGGVEFDCNGASPERIPPHRRYNLGSSPGSVRVRPHSTDLSPARGSQLSPPRRLSTPASPSRINITTPPRLYLPVQHPHPVPLLAGRIRGPRFDHLDDHNESDDDDDFAPVLAVSRASKEDGLDILRPEEELPTGTPGGSKADLKRGALIDGQRPEKGAIRFFSRDMYGPVFNSPSPETTPPRSITANQPLSDEASSASMKKMSKRSSSPFEIKLAPNVTKRMSLDAFGASPPASSEDQPADNKAEAILDELEEPSFEMPQSSEGDPLTYFHGTQLSTIQESEPGEGESWNASRIVQTPRQPARTEDKTTGPHSPFLPPREPPEHGEESESFPSRSEASIISLNLEIDELRRSLTSVEAKRSEDCREREAAERVVLQLRLENEEKDGGEFILSFYCCNCAYGLAVQQLRDALRENEEFFDKLQAAHDDLALKCTELRAQHAKYEHQLSVDTATLRASQSDTSSLRAKLQIVERTNGHLIRTLAEAKGREAELAATSKEAEQQVKVKSEDLATAIGNHERQLAALKRQIADKDSTIARMKEEAGNKQAKQMAEDKGRLEQALTKLTEKDGVIAELRDKLQTARFETDEKVIASQSEATRLQGDIRDSLAERGKLEEALDAYRKSQANQETEKEAWNAEKAQLSDLIRSIEGELEDALERLDTANSALSFQDQELATLRETAFEAADTANRISDDAVSASKESDRVIRRLREVVEELQYQITAVSTALQSAVTERELAKSQSGNDRSRLDAYLSEIDRLKLSEASLSYQLESLQRQSANDELSLVELRKDVSRLEEDKELLNVALESKQTELTLLQRQLAPKTAPTTPRTQRTGAVSRIPQTPTNKAIPETPKRIAPSTSTGSIKFSRRESSVVASTPCGPVTVAMPASASRVVLGSTTRHNRTPDKGRPRDGGAASKKPGVNTTGQQGLKRQSSLPILSTRLHTRAGVDATRKVTSLVEEAEEVMH